MVLLILDDNAYASGEDAEDMWKCEVCGFHNKKGAKNCVLCGTEHGMWDVNLWTKTHGKLIPGVCFCH